MKKKELKKVYEALDNCEKLSHILNESLYETTVCKLEDIVMSLVLRSIIGKSVDKWALELDNARSERGGFIIDNVYNALFQRKKLKEIMQHVDEGRQAIKAANLLQKK